MAQNKREGTLVEPILRLNGEHVRAIHKASLSLLDDPGIFCFNETAAGVLNDAGCSVSSKQENQGVWRIRFPAALVEQSLESAPEKVVLGARNPKNRLVLDARVPEVYFGTGSETNIYLDTRKREYVCPNNTSLTLCHPSFHQERGSIEYLCQSAKLCDVLQQVDFFIRNVNIQNEGITPENKDVNVFLASLMYSTKHVQSGLVELDSLKHVLRLAELISEGSEGFPKNPVISFITCVIKSPLQMVDDTTEKLIAIAGKNFPVVISGSPQGGSTAPIEEEGMTAMINAEILAGITLTQIINPGTPVLYGAVPVRARLDTLHDLYGVPEVIHYNTDCIQMARHYGIPCYSTAGVGDAKVPGMQATIEKVFSQLFVAAAGAQYIHYAFGLLDKTNIFSPLQAVLDDAQIGLVRGILRRPVFTDKDILETVEQVKKVMDSKTRLFARHIRKAMRKGLVSLSYPFETRELEDRVLINAFQKLKDILSGPDNRLDETLIEKIYREIPGLLPRNFFEIPGIQD
ncbi:MAG: trimethylamine methyltransferase family protein [Candidatus Aminicenantes bacterium]|nr:trimethylamine methyltransferase family protein [Candidatus Aminicenantes bacterium]